VVHSIAAYWDAGRKAAEARNEQDNAGAERLSLWFRNARNEESDANRQQATDAYQKAYRQHRRI
jgi:hypothetical protein